MVQFYEVIWKTFGYTALMGVAPKVQPTNTTMLASNIENSWLNCTYVCAS